MTEEVGTASFGGVQDGNDQEGDAHNESGSFQSVRSVVALQHIKDTPVGEEEEIREVAPVCRGVKV